MRYLRTCPFRFVHRNASLICYFGTFLLLRSTSNTDKLQDVQLLKGLREVTIFVQMLISEKLRLEAKYCIASASLMLYINAVFSSACTRLGVLGSVRKPPANRNIHCIITNHNLALLYYESQGTTCSHGI